jgi:hypothetical protein
MEIVLDFLGECWKNLGRLAQVQSDHACCNVTTRTWVPSNAKCSAWRRRSTPSTSGHTWAA